MRADDAKRAVDHGANAVWVSNHGGRQMDLAPATIDALAGVVEAVATMAGGAEVYLDGGVSSRTRALVALGLGARAVFVGRPVLWGLAVSGEDGVGRVLASLNEELTRALQLAGCADATAAREGLVRRR